MCKSGHEYDAGTWISYAHSLSFEPGVNLVISLNFQIKKSIVLSFHAGSGAHYFAMNTIRQSRGFAFTANFLFRLQHLNQIKNDNLFNIGFLA